MQKIFSNQPSHFIECESCGAKMTERPYEVWTNIPDEAMDFAIADNQRMEDAAEKDWEIAVDEFIERHKDCRNA